MGSVSLDDMQGDTETFEIQCHHTNKPSDSGALQTHGSVAPAETPPASPRLSLQSRGKEREPHGKIELREDTSFLVNLRTIGTRVRIGEEELLCLDERSLDEAGPISLGQDFREGSPEILTVSLV